MGLILHLADIHLGEERPYLDDDKTGLLPEEERRTATQRLQDTLRALASALDEQPLAPNGLDAVVITGDVTTQCRPEGYEQLETILDCLGRHRPLPERVLVVPGNHDVVWCTEPGSHDRYAPFIEHIREKQYITPVLEGIDTAPFDIKRHTLVAPDGAWALLALNTADWCGRLRPGADELERLLADAEAFLEPERLERAKSELRELRLVDAPRLSGFQQGAVAEFTAHLRPGATAAGRAPVLIAVLHHQLLPVTGAEEVKPFETLTNLGAAREFLARQGLHVVLHGHKHQGHEFYDHIESLGSGGARRLLVVSGSDIAGDEGRHEVARLLRIGGSDHARLMEIASLPGLDPHATLPNLEWRRYPLWGSLGEAQTWTLDSPETLVITDRSLDQVYHQVLTLLEHASGPVYNVICQVLQPEHPLRLPLGYPPVPGLAATDEGSVWLAEVVDWWQRQDSRLEATRDYQHGRRLRAYARTPFGRCDPADQIQRIVRQLADQPNSSRAVAVLLNPSVDRIDDGSIDFPSFCLVQFILRETGTHASLDCVAYYRKQEFCYWWPVNVAELAHLQHEIARGLDSRERAVRAGSVTTIAAVAKVATAMPYVAVPETDRRFDGQESVLRSMVHELALVTELDAAQRASWLRLLDELAPPERFEPDGAPIAQEGLRYVVEQLASVVAVAAGAPRAQPMLQCLQDVIEQNDRYRERFAAFKRGDNNLPEMEGHHAEWHTKVDAALDRAHLALDN